MCQNLSFKFRSNFRTVTWKYIWKDRWLMIIRYDQTRSTCLSLVWVNCKKGKKVARRTSSSSCIEDFTGVLRPHFSSTTPTRILFTAPPPTSKPLAVIGRDSTVVVLFVAWVVFVALFVCVRERHCWAGENARPRPLYLCPRPVDKDATALANPNRRNTTEPSHSHQLPSRFWQA